MIKIIYILEKKFKKNKDKISKIKEEIFFVPTIIKELNELLYKYLTISCHANYKILKSYFY